MSGPVVAADAVTTRFSQHLYNTIQLNVNCSCNSRFRLVSVDAHVQLINAFQILYKIKFGSCY